MTQGVRQTGEDREIDRIRQIIHIFIILNIWAVTKHIQSPSGTRMYFYEERIEVDNPKLVIPYRSMKNIENITERRISILRVVVLGLIFVPLAIVGALWKKNHICTIIRFNDDSDDQMVIVDFDQNLDSAQSVIYNRMLEFRNKG
jgi:hypothetical protein